MQDVLMRGLKEFGERWSKQWVKPVNYSEPLVQTFADTGCFVMRRFDKLDKVANQVYDFEDVMPGFVNMDMLGSATDQRAAPYQRPSQPLGGAGENNVNPTGDGEERPPGRETTSPCSWKSFPTWLNP